ncbi:hypothetical protein [Ferrimicrobium acidiphilum]|uniref:hypothetical protein n=1 Tax=Ferrimicrobium acidiphilum TaxID=121039 RepID=UPI0023F38E0C
MSLGIADSQSNFFDDMAQFCEKTLPKDSIYAFLHDERNRLGCNAYLTPAFRAREATVSLACSNLVVRDGGAAKSVMQWWGDVFGLGGRTALLRHYGR